MKLIMENWKRYLNEQSPAGFYGDLPKKDQERIGKAQQAMLDARKAKLSGADAETLRMLIGFFDPTQISAYPDIPPAIKEFDKNPTVYNGGMLAVSLAAAIPLLGKAAQALKAIVGLRKVTRSLRALPPPPRGADLDTVAFDDLQRAAKKADKTLDELPSPQEMKRRKREYLRDRAAQQIQSPAPRPKARPTIRQPAPGTNIVPSEPAGFLSKDDFHRVEKRLEDQSGDTHQWLDKETLEHLPSEIKNNFKKSQKFVRRKAKERDNPEIIDARAGTVDYIPDEIPRAYDNPPRSAQKQQGPETLDTKPSSPRDRRSKAKEHPYDDDPRHMSKDPMFGEAIRVLRRDRRASIGHIQRKLAVSYNRAARILDKLEEIGYIKRGAPGTKYIVNKAAVQNAVSKMDKIDAEAHQAFSSAPKKIKESIRPRQGKEINMKITKTQLKQIIKEEPENINKKKR